MAVGRPAHQQRPGRAGQAVGVLAMSGSLRLFPKMAHLEEQSCKEKSKLPFRDFNSEQEPHFMSLKPPLSRDGDGADVS